MAKGNMGGKRALIVSANESTGFSETYSRYAADHKEIVDYVKKQVGVDLNKYRDGDGTSANTTSRWDKDGPKVAVDWKNMPETDRQKLRQLAAAYGGDKLRLEQGGSWFYYVSKGSTT